MRTIAILLTTFLATGLTAQVSYYAASLDGSQEVPPVVTNGKGWAIVRLDAGSGQVLIFLESTGVPGTAAHLHLAPAGVNGPVIVPLAGGPGRWTGAGTLTAAQVAALQNGGTYVNVHSAANPGGEIRGQVVTASARRFQASLDGSQEVPPNNSQATGEAVAFLHEPDNVLTYVVSTRGLQNVVAAHIHMAPAGQNGGVIHPLIGSAGSYCGVTPKLTAAQLTALANDGLYFNVHTAAFPGGEIRGQIRSNVGDLFAPMDGSQEVPPVQTNAIGEACLTINGDNTVSYRVTTQGLVGIAAHVHVAPAGQNGGVLFPLSGGPTVYAGTSPVLTAADLTDARTGRWYVNVHTAANPGGEIRGQVRIANLPSTYGGSCQGTNAALAEIGSNGVPCIGSRFSVTLSGSAANAPAILSLGFSRDTIAGLPLPLDLAILGAGGCFLLQDMVLTFGTLNDGNGCAAIPLPVSFDPNLRGASLYGQWYVIDRGANNLNLVTTNGLSMVIH